MSRPENWTVRELRPGDQIRVKHMTFHHHGLYEGDGMVIHFAGPDSATLTDVPAGAAFRTAREMDIPALTSACAATEGTTAAPVRETVHHQRISTTYTKQEP